ncbi:DUF4352 domain-containing protein [Bacillus massiliigorillae]|uniref:DUF4352 domain-containing protein n=1 Tax=Bacillus massiliigorillae TaxID=1243664 RepID=UPI0003AA1D86|nr:DUF4352 domain-containing protein [Bacillus massiliigorillae]
MKKFLKIIAIILGGFIVIGIIGSMGDDESSTDEKASTEVKADQKKEAKKEESKTYQVGDMVNTGKLAYKVTNVTATNEIKSNNQFIESATTSGQFVIIDIEAVNNDSKARMVDSSMFKVVDDKKREFDPSTDSDVTMALEGSMDFFLQDINPGLSKTGKMVFELPADSTSYSLQVSSGFGWSGGEYEKIKLK